MIGFIYIMSNPSHPDLVKIGQTSKDPEERRRELYTTGVPTDFVLEYWALSDDYVSLELEIHRSLDHLRFNQNKEFFNISVPEAINEIRERAGDRLENEKVFYVSPVELERIPVELERIPVELERIEKIKIEEEKRKKRKNDKVKAENKKRISKEVKKMKFNYHKKMKFNFPRTKPKTSKSKRIDNKIFYTVLLVLFVMYVLGFFDT